ncbi:MAG: DUF3891 family protein [Pirellulales bacterium]
MIRREITSPDGTKLWLLISQVEHARVSGELTRNWHEEFTEDVIEAVTHHDDGWAAWETEPKLNPEIGAPFSFLEMPLPAALVIWDHSIAAVARFGPLASYMVAGHFYKLLSESEQANKPLAAAWLAAKRKQRTAWLDQWVRADSSHTLEYAKRAQHMLLVADLFSLWLCCDAPVAAGQESILRQSAMKLRTDTLLNQYDFAVPEFKTHQRPDGNRIGRLTWSVAARPYPCKTAPLELSAQSLAAPAKRYASWDEFKAASWPLTLEWRLVEGTSPAGPAA